MANAITSKGQVTIPKVWRDKFGLKPGETVVFAANDRGELTLTASSSSSSDFRAVLEKFRGTATAGLTTDEIMVLSRGEVDLRPADATKPSGE